MTVPFARNAGFRAASFSAERVRPRMLVAVDVPDGNELVVEAAGLGGGRVAPLALEREGVLLLARDLEALGHVLSRLAHRLEREHLLHARVREAPAERRVPDGPVAPRVRALGLGHHERRAAHRLDAARDEELAVPGAHRMAGGDDRREARRAEPVDRDAGDLLRQPGEERGHARDVAVVLSGLVRAAEVDVLDLAGRNARALDGLADDERGEIVRTLLRERAAVAADGRPDGGEDDGLGHAPSLFAGPRLTAARNARATRRTRRGPALEGARLLAAAKQLGDGLAALLAVVLGQLVHVHAHEPVRELRRQAPPELEGVLERLVAVLEPCPDRVAQNVGELAERLRAEIAAGDVDPERKRKPGLEEPPLAEVDDALEPLPLVRELAFVDEEPGLGACRSRPPP